MKWLIASAGQLLFTLCMYGVGVMILGLALFPALLACVSVWSSSQALTLPLRVLALSFGVTGGYFLFGITLMLLLGCIRIIFGLTLKPGEYPMYSLGALKWAVVNSLVLVLSNTFMDFMLITPFVNIFYRLMGAKLGKNVQINSKNVADLSLLEIDDGAVIGGHATVIGHSFERGRIILKKVKIGKRAVVGLNSVVLPGCEIGDHAILAAGTVLAKNTIVEPRSVYCGVPAMPAKERRKHNNGTEGTKS